MIDFMENFTYSEGNNICSLYNSQQFCYAFKQPHNQNAELKMPSAEAIQHALLRVSMANLASSHDYTHIFGLANPLSCEFHLHCCEFHSANEYMRGDFIFGSLNINNEMDVC